MFDFFKKTVRKSPKFDIKVLRRNDISLLTLDERWNSLFANAEKTPEIISCEYKIKELLKEQSRVFVESKDIAFLKKRNLDKIINLTTEVFDKNNEEAKNEMQACEKEIKRINERAVELEEKLEQIPEQIKEANLELLEYTVNIVYFKMRANQLRVKELTAFIEETKTKIKEAIDEKESLSKDDSDIYSYFHDLLGGEELERLDKEFFSHEGEGYK
jgi:chromosome segregation ATPase